MVEERVTTLEGKMDQMLASNGRIEAVLLGDPTDPSKPGVVVRLDRLERTSSGWTRFLWLAAGVVLTAAVAAMAQGS